MTTRALAALVVLLALPAGSAAAAGPDLSGPMVGHVSPTSATIWIYAGGRPGLRVYFRPESAPRRTARFADMPAYQAGPQMARVILRGLSPDTAYVFRVVLQGRSEPHWTGRFRTPPPEGTRGRFKVAVTSCMKPKHGQQAWQWLLAEKPEVHLLLGDNVYSDSTKRAVIWRHHLEMRRVWTFRAVLRAMANYATWDDHDFATDNIGGLQIPRRRGESLQAFREVWANPSAGLPGVPGVFFRFTWGDVELFVLDGRYHRSALDARDDARKKMIGDAQFRWLAAGLRTSRARFKVIASGSAILGDQKDTWSRYSHALHRILEAIVDGRVGGVLWLSGDLHLSRIDTHRSPLPGMYDLTEVISSGIANSPTMSFATLAFDTTREDPAVHIRIHHGHTDGKVVQEKVVHLSELQVRP